TYEGVSQVEHDFRPGKNEVRFKLKPHAHALGLTVSDLAHQVFAGYFGEEALRLQRGRDDIRVRVRYPIEERSRLSELNAVRIRTPRGFEVPLRSVADVSYGPGYAGITRTNGLRRIQVDAEVDYARANPTEITNDLQTNCFPGLRAKHPGVMMSLQGAKRDTAESMNSLFIGFPLALIGIFVIIATTFRSYAQPVIIMFTIPFGIIGALIGHLVMGLDVTLISLFGIVALSGVVVNDAIVLIECINSLIANGMPVFDALKRGGARRFRAIFLTTITTIGGLYPMIAEKDFQAQFLIPMALSLAYGVGLATLLTLFLEPCFLGILNDIRRLLFAVRRGRWPTPEEVEPAAKRDEDLEQLQDEAPAPPKAFEPAGD
ncbi:MAG TPA: efflux RND transporter permease subunit, partial [Candidatus Hydrogenedentes bacterium]|nr:efflux RND transporter permease subunit [Candidatus Hydrogenedentota bacterium]